MPKFSVSTPGSLAPQSGRSERTETALRQNLGYFFQPITLILTESAFASVFEPITPTSSRLLHAQVQHQASISASGYSNEALPKIKTWMILEKHEGTNQARMWLGWEGNHQQPPEHLLAEANPKESVFAQDHSSRARQTTSNRSVHQAQRTGIRLYRKNLPPSLRPLSHKFSICTRYHIPSSLKNINATTTLLQPTPATYLCPCSDQA